ncbi:hypothetical protein BKA70DRAFT_1444082 [Coprinopsis sp. MPI-PUGE-AT-0042]|nr:hypothetical protein BKA70DRAFT_1444082 [Coprinopsis sp. MPI-PUGE-AT-0042]
MPEKKKNTEVALSFLINNKKTPIKNVYRLTNATLVLKLPDDSCRTITAQHVSNIIRANYFLCNRIIPNYLPTNYHHDIEFINNNAPDSKGLCTFNPVTRSITIFPGKFLNLADFGLDKADCGFKEKVEPGTIRVHGDDEAAGMINRFLLKKAKEADRAEPKGRKRRRGNHGRAINKADLEDEAQDELDGDYEMEEMEDDNNDASGSGTAVTA